MQQSLFKRSSHGLLQCGARILVQPRLANRSRVCTAANAAKTAPAVVGMSNVVIFTTPGCKFCRRAKQALGEQGVPYKEVDVSVSSELRSALKAATGQQTVPQVYANGVLVGGSDTLVAKISDGSFAELLQSQTNQDQLPASLQQAMEQAAAQAGSRHAANASPVMQLSPDLQQLLAALSDKSSGISRAAQPGRLHSNAFTGKTLIDWLLQHSTGTDQASPSRAAAAATAGQLLAANAITLVAEQQPKPEELAALADDDSHWYRLRSEAPREVPWGSALNTAYWWGPSPARPAEEVAEDLRGRILALYDKYLRPDGKAVSYKALNQDPGFWDYVDATAELQRVDLSPLSREALMCFAINLYNALVIHTLVVHGTQKYSSTTGRLEFFQKAARYNIGGFDYVLDDLENGILRGNQPAASSIGMLLRLPWLSKGPFKQGDPRAQHVVSPVEPRIHFALVCGAKSCPPIKLYSPDTLEEGLIAAAEAFCASDVSVDVAAKKVSLSKIFNWYYPDFGADKAARLRFLLPYLSADQRSKLEQLLAADAAAHGIKVHYTAYDWDINAADEP